MSKGPPGEQEGSYSSFCYPQVIYMARNPKDLVVSYYQFHRSLRTMSYRGTFQEFCRRFMNDKCKCQPVCTLALRIAASSGRSSWEALCVMARHLCTPIVQLGLEYHHMVEVPRLGSGATAQILGLLRPAPPTTPRALPLHTCPSCLGS